MIGFRSQNSREVSNKIATPLEEDEKDLQCSVLGCERLTRRSAQEGLDKAHCKYHADFLRKHGCTWRSSFTQQELESFRWAAKRWFRKLYQPPLIQRHLDTFKGWYLGREYLWHESSFLHVKDTADFKCLSVIQKARFKAIQLVKKGIPVERIVVDVLAVEAATRSGAVTSPSGRSWVHHQIGKALSRKAGGLKPNGYQHRHIWVWRSYPVPSGRWVSLLGEYFHGELLLSGELSQVLEEIIKLAEARIHAVE